MIKPTEQVLQSIAELVHNSDFINVANWVRESVSVVSRSNVTVVDELQFRWNQGKLQNMNDILRSIDEVFILLELYKQYAPPGPNPDI
jgi:hypothetical protein